MCSHEVSLWVHVMIISFCGELFMNWWYEDHNLYRKCINDSCWFAYVDDGFSYGNMLIVLSLLVSWMYGLILIFNDMKFWYMICDPLVADVLTSMYSMIMSRMQCCYNWIYFLD